MSDGDIGERSWLPGYTVLRRIGVGAFGEVVAAREDATGQTVALKRLRANADQQLRREAAMLAAFDHPSVIRLREIAFAGDQPVLILDYASGGDVCQLVAERGKLSAGEVARIVADGGAALGNAHRAGLIHGDVSARNVLLSAAGRPLLGDLGTARLAGQRATARYSTPGFVDPAGGATVATDVYGLAAVAAYALVGQLVPETDGAQKWAELAHARQVAPELVGAICRGLAADPARRPSLDDFVLGVVEAAGEMTEAIKLAPDSVAAGTELAHTRVVSPLVAQAPASTRWQRFRAVVGAALPKFMPRLSRPTMARLGLIAAVIVVAIAGGLAWAAVDKAENQPRAATGASPTSASPPLPLPATPSPSPTPLSAAQWTTVLTELDEARSAAFSKPDKKQLDKVYTPGSKVLQADEKQLAILRDSDSTAEGVRHEINVVSVISDDTATGGTAVLRTTDTLRTYRIRDKRGTIVREVPAGASRELTVMVRQVDGDWRISDIQAG